MRVCVHVDCDARALPNNRWCAEHTPPWTFLPVSTLCARCGREHYDHTQMRDGKPPHCPTMTKRERL
jgi:hypothetical protein